MFKRFFLLAVSFFLMTSINTINANDHNAGDPAKGKKVFKKCAACHSIAESAKHKTGPNLWNIYGNKAFSQWNIMLTLMSSISAASIEFLILFCRVP